MNGVVAVVPVAFLLVVLAVSLVTAHRVEQRAAEFWQAVEALPGVEQGDGASSAREFLSPIPLLDGRTSAQQPLRPRTVAPLVRVRGRSSTPQS